MARWSAQRRKKLFSKSMFSVYYILFILFIYGPMFAMFILSFQGRRGG
jgi:putative spermidine/putrescine transport system permease protein